MIDYSKLPRADSLCLDVKSFYASVECVSRGLDPLTTYLAVVGDIHRSGSVILAASPMMKKEFGIKTGSRLFEVPKNPKILIVEARMASYLQVSMQITRILNRFVPLEAIHVYSVDEAWCTLDGSTSLWGSPWEVAQLIKEWIYMETGLPCAVGIGDNKLLSKLILDVAAKKVPEGIAECRYEDVPEKLWPAKIRDVWGIGRRMERNLNRLGIFVLGDLARYPLELLQKKYGIMGEQLYWHAHGVDMSPTIVKQELNSHNDISQKGYSSGITLLRNYTAEELPIVILEQAETVAMRARENKMAGRTVHLGVGYSDDAGGGGFSRSRSFEPATNVTTKIHKVCLELLKENYNGKLVRNVYVSLTNLSSDEIVQLDLFEDNSKERDLGYTMDAIRKKYGLASIMRASSLTAAGTLVDRSSKIGGHKV